MTTVGAGRYAYEVNEHWGVLPDGWTFGPVSAVATDSQDRVYAFQRKDPPVLVFDRNGTYLTSWGSGAITDPHGISITDDVVYLTDRNDHVALKFTLDGKPLMVLGKRGQPSDTGATKDIELPPRSAGPFNKPTEMVVAPSGDLYVSDGYRYASAKYSPLDQINAGNVATLAIAWRWTSPDHAVRAANPGIDPSVFHQGTPIMVKGVLYRS